ncbi:MAG TPA: hypothetical protein VEL28_12375 [Candidatus Binatia bacterium]|nr:hypothetical protein [Candidatus Binatia bacterium]
MPRKAARRAGKHGVIATVFRNLLPVREHPPRQHLAIRMALNLLIGSR